MMKGALLSLHPSSFRSRPVGAVERAVADGLGDVPGEYLFGGFEVGDGAADFEDAVVGARRKPLPRHRLLQKALAFRVEAAVAPDESRRHLRVREDAAAAEALALARARRHDARAHRGRASPSGAVRSESSLKRTAGTSTWMSMRSRS